MTYLSLHPHTLDVWLTYGNSGHSYFALQRLFVDFIWRRSTDEDCRCGRKFWTLYIFYWIKVFLKLPFAISFSVFIYIYMYFWITVQLEKVLYALNAEQHSSFWRRCLINSSCDSEFHIHGVTCMIVRHKENVLGSATHSDFYVSC